MSTTTCTKCSRNFSSKAAAQVHLLIHLGIRPFTCERCNSTFRTRQHLERHFRYHTGERPFSCGYCDKRFSDPSTLKSHLNSRHLKRKAYTCDACNKRFVTAGNRNLHRRIHMGIRPYKCSICSVTNSDLSNFKRHIKACQRKLGIQNTDSGNNVCVQATSKLLQGPRKIQASDSPRK
mmetsp:Transcript_31314/g.76388  ORF Transcript_31314/g.76388 Transcript_31314/m.76388 type:complete len:178 (-) Transcript_31314:101-634(-)